MSKQRVVTRLHIQRLAPLLVLMATCLIVIAEPVALEAQSASETVTFDDTIGQDRVLSGQYPSGVIDWGTSAWFLSAPWRQLTTKSIGFNGPGRTSESFAFVVPRTLLQIDAYNGGTAASIVSLACSGQLTRTVTVPVNTAMTIPTGWTGTCSNVQVSSSNGWNTNFDNLVLAGAGPLLTPTPTPGPARFAVSEVSVTNTTAQSVTIAWTTTAPATSQINYGPTSAYGSTTPFDSALSTVHSQTISGLTTGATFAYQVVSRDASGVQAVSTNRTFVVQDAAVFGIWTDPVALPLVPTGLDVLPNGTLLMVDEPAYSQQPIVFDPRTFTWTTVPLVSSLFCSAQSMLADGRLIAVGGHGSTHLGIPDANIFEPSTNRWISAASMAVARWYPSTTLLGDGRVLAISGMIDNNAWADTPEIYDPRTNTWSRLGVSTGDIHEIEYPLTFLLPTGQTATIGVTNGHINVLDAVRQTWTALPTVPTLNGSAAHYRPGKILVTGGGTRNAAAIRTATSLDLTQFAPSWQPVPAMNHPRFDHNLTMLADGTVFAVGGADWVTEYTASGTLPTEVWDPLTNVWSVLAAVHEPRLYHSTSALLPDGRVIVGGGGSLAPNVDHRNVELFSPPYLFKGPRPTITAAPSTLSYGQTFTISTPDAATTGRVSLIPFGAVTHTADMDQRYLELGFASGTGGLSVFAPSDANTAPPGTYMLFVINSAGVPSVAAIVRISGPSSFDSIPPAAALTSPTAAATINGNITLQATASDDTGVSDVQFLVGASIVGHATAGTPSYSAVWDTRTVPDGAYVIAARARDAAGNVASSAPVQVTVNNGGGLPTATPTATPTVTPTPAPINGRLGNTNVGVTIDSGDSNAMNGSRVTTGAQPITVRSISVFVAGIDSSTANRSYQVAIFSDNTGRPGTLVASSATGTLSANSWNTLPISGANLAANSSYWLMYNTNGRTSALNNMRRDDGVPGTGAYSAGAVPFGTWPSNFGTSVTGVWSWSIYLTF